VLRYLPEKQRYTLELLEPLAGGGGAGKRMDVRPANFALAHLPAGTRCARAKRLHSSGAVHFLASEQCASVSALNLAWSLGHLRGHAESCSLGGAGSR
jgi:hypothetical protein